MGSIERSADSRVGRARLAVLARDIARAGIAGAMAGVLVAGIGGRVVMRFAAIAIPGSEGMFTENGNRIGDITIEGSLALLFFGGLLFGGFAAIIWVVVSPWIPGRGIRRALLAMPITLAIGGTALIQGGNTDFLVLEHSPVVVAMLAGLVAIVGLGIALLDDWLEGRLPAAGTERAGVAFAYAALIAGGLLLLPIAMSIFFDARSGVPAVGLALVVTGFATLAWWVLRYRGETRPPPRLLVVGSAALVTAVVLGAAALIPEVAEALGVA
jgi:hypothetical protein